CMGLASAAAAGDLGGSLKDDYSAPAGHNWTGCYLGLHGGYGWGEWDGHMIYTDAKPNDGFDSSGKTIDLDGGLVGGQAGCNLQLGNFILGIEGDIAHSGIDGGKTFLPPSIPECAISPSMPRMKLPSCRLQPAWPPTKPPSRSIVLPDESNPSFGLASV